MADLIYRSAKVIVQVNGLDNFVLGGFDAVKGDWTTPPEAGEQVIANGSLEWTNETKVSNLGCAGYLTFTNTSGHQFIAWELPWIGDFEFRIFHSPDYRLDVQLYDAQPDHVALWVTFWAQSQWQLPRKSIEGTGSMVFDSPCLTKSGQTPAELDVEARNLNIAMAPTSRERADEPVAERLVLEETVDRELTKIKADQPDFGQPSPELNEAFEAELARVKKTQAPPKSKTGSATSTSKAKPSRPQKKTKSSRDVEN